jgi:transposase
MGREIIAGRVAMEACGSSHHWGRWFAARGHTTRLIAAEFVKPFRLSGKNDAADAEAIAIAARQPTMRFVAIKSIQQQAILAWHSVRAGWQEERTALLKRVTKYGDSASVQAVTRVNAEQASKRTMRRPT